MDSKRKQAPSKWSLATRILTERRAILSRLTAPDRRRPIQDRGCSGGDNTPTSEIAEVAQEAVAIELEFASREVLVRRLKALARAEEKIREGTYGRCDACGRPIPAARLRAMPEAVLCVPCAVQGERQFSSPYPTSAAAAILGRHR